MALTPKLVSEMFPKVKFAFFGNYINRYRRKLYRNELPSIDLILAVENTKEFHAENLKRNKKHYTYFVRSTYGFAVHWIQDMAARMHFNHVKLNTSEHTDCLRHETEEECPKEINIRYGVIALDDMVRDLHHWETLLTSSFM